MESYDTWPVVTSCLQSAPRFQGPPCRTVCQHFIPSYARATRHVWTGHIWSSVDEHSSCFHFWPLMSNAAVNICAQFLCRHASSSFGHVPSRGTAGSEGNCVQFLKNCQSIFTKCLPNFTAQSVKVPVSPHPHQRLLLPTFGTLAILEASHCGFHLLFPNDWGYWVPLYVLIGHLCVFFGEMSV